MPTLLDSELQKIIDVRFLYLAASVDGVDNQLTNDLVDCVRQCVREKLSRRSSGQQSLIQRTRQLISSSVSSVSRDLSSSGNTNVNGGILIPGRSNVSAGQPIQIQSSNVPGIKRPQNFPGHI